MFKNMKLGGKLTVGFSALVLLIVIIALSGYIGLSTVTTKYDAISEIRLPSIARLQIINESQTRIWANELGLLNRRMMDTELRKSYYEALDTAWKDIDKAWKIYEPLPQTKSEEELWKKFVPAWDQWKKEHQKVVNLSREKDKLVAQGVLLNDKRITSLDDQALSASLGARKSYVEAEKLLGAVVDENMKTAEDDSKGADAADAFTRILLIVLSLISVVAGIGLAFFFVKNINGIMQAIMFETAALIDAAVAGKLATRGDVKKINFEFKPIIDGLNKVLDAVIGPLNVAAEYIDRIAKGDIPPQITDTYNGDFNEIKNNLNQCIAAVNLLVSDANVLSRAAIDGKLATRADATRHQGDFRAIVKGVNETLDAVIGPLNVAAEYVDRISKGEIPAKITDTYNGDFNEIKNNLNQCIDAINLLVKDANVLAVAAVEGKLATRADATKHQGDFRVIVEGVNNTLDSVIGPLNVAAEYVDRIAKGDIPPKIIDNYNGDFNEIKNNLNQCIDALSGLISEMNNMATEHDKGDIDVIVDAKKFQGAYQLMGQGINAMVQGHISVKKKAMACISELGKGNFNAQLEKFPGKKAFINDAIEALRENLKDINKDIGVLIQATKEGKLSTRGNEQKFNGDWAMLVKNINELIDAFVAPINVTAEYVDRIAKGDIPPKITDTYNGDFNEIKNNLNTCIDALSGLISEMNKMSTEHEKGDIDVMVDDKKFQGAYQLMGQGVNEMVGAHIAVKKKAMAVFTEFGNGNFEANMETLPGKKIFINNTIEQVRANLKALIADADMLARAAMEGKLATRADATKHKGDFRKIVEGVNGTLDAVIGPLNVAAEYVDRIAKGDIPPKITDNYNGDFNEIKNNLNTCVDAVNLLVKDANILAKAAVEGKLATRADASRHQGDFQKIVEGVNGTLDAVIGPLNVAAEYVDRIGKGNIPAKITDNYNGDFNEIKNNLNQCIDAVNLLVKDANVLALAAVEGKLSTRADVNKHQGDFRVIVEGVNNTLDSVIGPLNVAANYVDRISKGDIPAKITDTYNGDFNTIKNNLNQCIDAVNLLVKDANILAKAAIEGKLATRADASRHQGDFQKIVEGVNGTLDAVIGPLNVAAEYIDRIAKGEIPAKITDTYNGDFNEIKNNLNMCIDAVNLLVADANVLAKAAVEGKLATRADATKHGGDFRKIVEGVNGTLDAVIGPLNVAAEYIDRIAKGEIPAKITDTYNGDFNEIKNNLNMCIDAVNLLVADANVLAKAAVEGKLATRADATKHGGDFRAIVEGVNNTLDSVIGPLNVAAEYVDRIAKGEIPAKITDTYNGDFNEIKNNLNMCIDAVNLLVADANVLAKAAVEGKLATRADATKHGGDFRKIVEGVNGTLDAVIGPLNVAAEYIDRIAKGEIPAKITDTYNGDFNEIKNNLNMCIDAVNLLVADANVLAKAAVEGKLATRADATKHGGDFRAIVEGVNNTLDSVIGPLNVAAEYVDRIGKGDIPPKITDTYNGDFNEIKNNLNMCIDAVNLLVSDANVLAKAAIEGKLATRADATRHQGDFRAIVEGVNGTLDAVIGPLNVAAEYVDRIAKGDIPPKITDSYNGDFNEIKNNLNQCIDALSGLISEMNKMSKEHEKGDIDVMVEDKKFQGAYQLMGQGINEMVGAHIAVKKKAMAVFTEFGNGNFEANMETLPGKKIFINNTIEQVRDNLKALIADTDILAKAAIEGKLATRADATKHKGDFRKIVEGVNGTLDAVIGPLNVAAEYVEKISKGNIPAKITDTYNGDFNTIKNNLNQCIDAVNLLVADANMLAKAAAEGKFEVRAESDNHNGDFKKIVVGVNNTLDTVIQYINETMFVLSDVDTLVQDIAKGKLSSRVDLTKHKGDMAKIARGLNDTIDAIMTPVNEAVESLKAMANGDLTAKMEGRYEGDHAVMKVNLNNALDAINEILSQVAVATNQVVDGAQQISDASQALSQGTTEQASSIEEISSSMTQLSSQITLNAENANQADQLTGETKKSAESGNEQMGVMMTAMYEINDASQNIAKIIKVIDEIAFQTNLLALNAAVEAARAGKHGKGFAVVAEEVRNLAARSAKAAKETAELIENSIKKTANGANIATKTSDSLSGIVTMVTKVSDLISEISAASNDQAQGITQVNVGLNQVDKVTQQSTANAEQSASASEELSGQALNLQDMLGKFKLNGHKKLAGGEFAASRHIGSGSKSLSKMAGVKPHDMKMMKASDVITLDDSEFGKY